ncbi:cytochrome P450 [Nocardia sp. NPDC019395]|uniref:cytochrome P450 n=1 Tax=Nocardia sp. NPDC019395 TaxID=3154686 RepID=UPI0033C43D63
MQSQQAPPDLAIHPASTSDGPREPLWSEQFAADPQGAYKRMRQRYGTLAPVEIAPGIPATLVLGYHTAVKILNEPERFPADPRVWQATAPADSPIMPMVEWRPNAVRSSGAAHTRYRSATVSALDGVDLHALRVIVEKTARPIINSFCEDGMVDVIGQYALPLMFGVLNGMLGCSPDLGARMVQAMAAIFESSDADAEKANAMVAETMLELIATKRAEPGDDVTTRLLQHETGLTDEELIHQLVTLYGAGIEPPQNLICNALLLMLTDPRYSISESGFPPSARAALDEILVKDPPFANYCMSYPRQPVLIDDVWLPPDQPVLISISACNNDPAVNNGDYLNNRWNLAWGAGPHSCPMHAQSSAMLIAADAIDQLLDALPELQLAVPAERLTWRPGPFHRALASLPVVFPPAPKL